MQPEFCAITRSFPAALFFLQREADGIAVLCVAIAHHLYIIGGRSRSRELNRLGVGLSGALFQDIA